MAMARLLPCSDVSRKLSLDVVSSSKPSHCESVPVSRFYASREIQRSPLDSAFLGKKMVAAVSSPLQVDRRQRRAQLQATATATAPPPTVAPVVKYLLPTWTKFEMGLYPVFWETSTGRPPSSGERLTIYFNAAATSLVVKDGTGIGMKGGFNAPLLLCGGEARQMMRLARGPKCDPVFVINVNVPVFATTMEFVFTDGSTESETFQVSFELPAKWRNQPSSFFQENLKKELAEESACETAIFSDAALFIDRCTMPAPQAVAPSCDLDLSPGCTDPESPFYDPLANVDDGTCPADFTD